MKATSCLVDRMRISTYLDKIYVLHGKKMANTTLRKEKIHAKSNKDSKYIVVIITTNQFNAMG